MTATPMMMTDVLLLVVQNKVGIVRIQMDLVALALKSVEMVTQQDQSFVMMETQIALQTVIQTVQATYQATIVLEETTRLPAPVLKYVEMVF